MGTVTRNVFFNQISCYLITTQIINILPYEMYVGSDTMLVIGAASVLLHHHTAAIPTAFEEYIVCIMYAPHDKYAVNVAPFVIIVTPSFTLFFLLYSKV